MTDTMAVANTIRDQVGGRALFMLGARDLLGSADSLKFRVARNDKGVTHVVIKLDPSDTYTVEFFAVRGLKCREIASVPFVYADSLNRVIESHTGLRTSL